MTTHTEFVQDETAATPVGGRKLGQANYDLFEEAPPHPRKRREIIDAVSRGETIVAIENPRTQVISDSPLELRVQQFVHFGRLLGIRAEAPARLHTNAAIRHTATLQELMGVADTAYLTDGMNTFALGRAIVGEFLEEQS